MSLIILAIAVTGYRLDSPMLVNPDEPRYAEAAREMIETDDWLTPQFNYVERLDKPILFYWMIAWSSQVLGVSESSARWPSVIAGAATVALVFLVGCHLWNLQTGFLSAMLMLTCAGYLGLSRAALTDMTLTAFTTLAIYGECLMLYPYSRGGEALGRDDRRRTIGMLLLCAGSGLATLTKGPVGMLLPVAVGLVYILLIRQVNPLQSLSRRTIALALSVFCLITVPWYAAIIAKEGGHYVREFFFKHNIERVLSDEFHAGSLFYYVPVIAVGMLPWSVFLPGMVAELFFPASRTFAMSEDGRNKTRFLAVWFSVIVGFFSLSQSQLPTYILPSLPASSLLLGYYWVQLMNTPAARTAVAVERIRASLFRPSSCFLGLSLLVALVIPLGVWMEIPRVAMYATPQVRFAAGVLIAITLLGASITTLCAWRWGPRLTYAGFAASSIVTFIVVLRVVVPVYVEEHQIPNLQARWVYENIGPLPDLLSYGDFKTGFVYYARHRVDSIGVWGCNPQEELRVRMERGPQGQHPFVGFTRRSRWEELPNELRAGLVILLQQGEFIVFTNSSPLAQRLKDRAGSGK